jgi:hypothetical protein
MMLAMISMMMKMKNGTMFRTGRMKMTKPKRAKMKAALISIS